MRQDPLRPPDGREELEHPNLQFLVECSNKSSNLTIQGNQRLAYGSQGVTSEITSYKTINIFCTLSNISVFRIPRVTPLVPAAVSCLLSWQLNVSSNSKPTHLVKLIPICVLGLGHRGDNETKRNIQDTGSASSLNLIDKTRKYPPTFFPAK